MISKTWCGALLCVLSFAAAAQAPAPAPSSPAKKALVAKVLQIQQPAYDAFARTIVLQNTQPLLQQARNVVQQRVAAERRDAVWADIQADARKFAEEAYPILREQTVKLLPTTIGPLIEERFSEDELKQLVQVLESPVGKKFAAMNSDMVRVLAEKLMADTRPTLEPKMQALQQSMAARLAPPSPPAAAASR